MNYPSWLKIKAPEPEKLAAINDTLRRGSLHTVCENAICPNLGECFSRKTATFLIMGNVCTRNCRFCAVPGGEPQKPDRDEPARLARAVKELGLDYVVITSVTRDDLPDGGAAHFSSSIRAVREIDSSASIEVLIPDFRGSVSALETVLVAAPDVLNHNLETIKRLYDIVRPGADYDRSLRLLRRSKQIRPDIYTKAGLMLGLGETRAEILAAMEDLRAVQCDILTLGQYLAPSPAHVPVFRYVPPDEFEQYRLDGLAMGFKSVASGPLVRSSYRAREAVHGNRAGRAVN